MSAVLKRLIFLIVFMGVPGGSVVGDSPLATTAQITVSVKLKVDPIKPTVTVTASDPTASKVGHDPGSFLLRRSGDTSSTLFIEFTMGGTASNGMDYAYISEAILMPVGVSSKAIWISPNPDSINEGGMKTVTLILSSSNVYTVGSPATATVNIYDYTAVDSQLWSLYE